MVTIWNLLEQEKEKIKEMNELRLKIVEEKRMRDLDEANAWVTTDFKSKGATTDKLRGAVVKQIMNEFPNVYAQNKAKFEKLEAEVKLIREYIKVMTTFEVEEISDIKEPEDENKE